MQRFQINFQHLHPVDTYQDYAFFVHWCKPLPEAPKPPVPSNERVSQLVAKVVENAPITSQKAAERAKEAIKKQCISPPTFPQIVTQTVSGECTSATNVYKKIINIACEYILTVNWSISELF